jgi:hypothetical protein
MVLHMLLSGQRSLSKLNTAKHMIGKDDSISDAMIEESVRRVCAPTGGSKSSSSKLSFDVNLVTARSLFDPEFPFLTTSDRHQAIETMKTLCSAGDAKNSSGTWQPVLAKTALPLPHPFFSSLRGRLLSSSYFLQVLCSVVEFLVHPDNNSRGKNGKSSNKKKPFGDSSSTLEPSTMGELASRVVHLATLRLHAFSDASVMAVDGALQWETRLIIALGTLHTSANKGDLQAFTAPPGLEWVLAQHWRRGGVAQDGLRGVGVDMTAPLIATGGASADSSQRFLSANGGEFPCKDASSSSADLTSAGKSEGGSAASSLSAQQEQQLKLKARREAAQKRALDFINKQVIDRVTRPCCDHMEGCSITLSLLYLI